MTDMTAAHRNPLDDTIFRPTVASAALMSAAPARVTGTRTRAGNAMSRTRSALMTGAARAVETSGTKIAMAQVAVSAGVAKATLYNHFRTREAVLDALVADQVAALVAAQAGKPLEQALADAALAISANPTRTALARIEPAALASLARIDDVSAGWRCARAGVDAVLDAAGRAGSEIVLRWLASFLTTPGDARSVKDDVAVLLAGLPIAEPRQADGTPEAGLAEHTEHSVQAGDVRVESRPRPTPRSA